MRRRMASPPNQSAASQETMPLNLWIQPNSQPDRGFSFDADDDARFSTDRRRRMQCWRRASCRSKFEPELKWLFAKYGHELEGLHYLQRTRDPPSSANRKHPYTEGLEEGGRDHIVVLYSILTQSIDAMDRLNLIRLSRMTMLRAPYPFWLLYWLCYQSIIGY